MQAQVHMLPKPRTGAWKYTQGASIEPIVYGLLMMGDVDYEHVAETVRKVVPDAQTSVKSVASTATRLRKAGYVIPYRKPQAL